MTTSYFSSVINAIKGPFYAAAATSAFSVLFGLLSTDIVLAAGGAAVGQAVLELIPPLKSPAFASFFAALAAGFYSEFAAWFRKRPATVYMIASIIPLVPGGGMYYSMLTSLEGDPATSVQIVLSTLMTAFALAAGLAIANALGRLAFERSRFPRPKAKT
ncbi:MAG: threonine/serine exporter family protein [Spirochaetes bacterium]|nr:threonine/serine exporter family protein [Spirochaetota bacterium]